MTRKPPRLTATQRGARLAITATVLCLFPAICLGGIVRTLDGKTHEGDVKLDSTGQLTVTPKNAGPVKIDLADVLHASFKDPTISIRAAIPRTEGDRLPPPWVAINVGAVTGEPYAKYRGESGYSIRCQGGDLGARSDSFVFVQQPAAGDADLVCRFDDVAHPTRVAAGLMFRDGSDSDAPYVGIVHASGDLKFLKREKRGGPTEGGSVLARAPFPLWLRLVRRSSTVTAYTSPDAANWTQLASDVVPMGPTALAGIVVCTRENTPMGAHAQALRITTQQSVAAPTGPVNLPEGLMLRTGTLLARAEIARADDGSIRFSKGDRRDVSLSNLHVARIVFRELTPDMLSRIPAGRTGVLLRAGDFVEGDFKGIAGARIQLSSVLFGLQRFEIGAQAACVVLRDLDPARAQYVLRTTDGSIYMAKSAKVENQTLVVEDAAAGEFNVARHEVEEITAGPGKLQPLVNMKPSKVDAAPGIAPADACVLAAASSMTLSNTTPTHPILLRSACAAHWDVNRQYRLLTFQAGVPDAIAPTAMVRFVVLGDGKPLYKSPPRASTDAPLAASVALKDVKILTLALESTSSDGGAAAIPTPGLWSAVSLVK
jgi:hypothetical protein